MLIPASSITSPRVASNYSGCIHSGTWNEDRIKRLKQLWTDGLSASQIAAELGGTTRNAVIGKVHRLGLDARKTATRKPSVAIRKPLDQRWHPPQAKRRPPALPAPDRPILAPAPDGTITVANARQCHCRWPIGDPRDADFHFCGRNKEGSGAFCPHHAAMAYRPVNRRSYAS